MDTSSIHHIQLYFLKTLSLLQHDKHTSSPIYKNKALLSIGMFCDNEFLALFDDKKVYIIDKRTNKNIMHGTRNNKSTLYMVLLTTEQNENMTEC